MRVLGQILAIVCLGFAIYFAYTPWRVHGGRFVTEYMAASGLLLLIALVAGYFSFRSG